MSEGSDLTRKWEIAIKCSLKKIILDDPIDDFMPRRVDEGFRILPIETGHLPQLTSLPFHHRDPFDRLIIRQAMKENMPVCTSDENLQKYGIEIIWQMTPRLPEKEREITTKPRRLRGNSEWKR